MSIVPLERVTLIGLIRDKERLLDDLHQFGALEIIPLSGGENSAARGGPSNQARDALKFLLACPQRRRQATDDARFDPLDVERRALDLQRSIQALELERDDLLQRFENVKPFGNFRFVPLEQMDNQRLWFYVVPHKHMPKVEASGLPWEIAKRDHRFCYVVVLSPAEPESMPVSRVRIGPRSPAELAKRLEELELAIDDAQAERAYLTRWCLLFARDLVRLEDAAARAGAAGHTCDCDLLFALQAWVPREHAGELDDYAKRNGFVIERRPPASDESPPTLLRNAPRVEAGEDLVNFYMTPGYWTWDPARTVFVSFAVFFAMILADAGYAALLGLGLLVFWRWLGKPPYDGLVESSRRFASDSQRPDSAQHRSAGQRFRPLLALIVLASLVYGVLLGSYFGITPPRESLLGRLQLLDMNNSQLMMGIAVLVGGLHVVLANVLDARRHADWRDGLGSAGWAAAVAGGLLLGAGSTIPAAEILKTIGGGIMLAGLLLVVTFTAWREKLGKRLLLGLLGLAKISSAFGDVLSYLRLFALGLASASLASAFNEMAVGIHSALPRIGLLLALLVLLFGHTLNLLLGVSSGVIHGLRLNVIEFFNWGLRDEGRRFTPFRRKEGSLWN
jgi:V/A-type H+-transporting ATPase subunit I